MNTSKPLAAATIAALSAISLNGCSNAGSQFAPPATTALATQSRHQDGPSPASCVPKLWASSLSSNAVYGYTALNTTPCITLSGTYAGHSFNAPTTVAVWEKYLYVADLNNDRIVVFTITGSYVKWLSTTLGTTAYQPWGVCVSKSGIVGVGNRNGIATSGSVPGNVEFWSANAASGSTPTGYGNAILSSDQYCAFDKLGNFYVDGPSYASQGGGQQIAYLPNGNVNLPAQTLCNSGLGNAHYWVGMYSRIDSPSDQTLSVGGAAGSQTTEDVITWPVAGSGTTCSLTFGASSVYAFTSYPSTSDPMYQLAPRRGGSLGKLFIADYGDGKILRGPANGGAVTTAETVSATTGVATQPAGQY
jgi:hypothetical protein